MMIESGPEIGFKFLSASGVVGDSGKPIAVYGYSIKSGGTAGVLTFFNGTTSLAATGSFAWDETGTINVSKSFPLGCGVVMPLGCFASFDGGVTTATVLYRQVRTS
jgi:hypothetical protein